MPPINRIKKWFTMITLAVTLVSCRVFFTPVISISDLQNPAVRVVPVSISSDGNCNKDSLDEIVNKFQAFQDLQPLGCFEDNGKSLRPYWQATIPLLRHGDEGKIPYLSASIYYSKNSSIIVTFNPSFYDKLKKYIVTDDLQLKMTTKSDIDISFQINNNTDKAVKVATQGVFVDNKAIGSEMEIFEIKPGGKIWIRLSDVSVHSLVNEGIQPVGVIPAREN